MTATAKHRYPRVAKEPPAIQVVRALSPADRERLLYWMAEALPGPVRVGLRHLPAETVGRVVPEMIQ